jgi:hypothetical protein
MFDAPIYICVQNTAFRIVWYNAVVITCKNAPDSKSTFCLSILAARILIAGKEVMSLVRFLASNP